MSLMNTERLSTVVDYDELVTRCLNKIDFAERMLTLFQNHCGQELAHLEQACGAGDLESIRRISHRLAGAAANAAAGRLQDCAAELRRAATSGSLDAVSQCLGDLQREWRRFSEAMSPPDSEAIETISTGV